MDGNISEEHYDTKTFNKLNCFKYQKGDIMYIDDTISYHRMCNISDNHVLHYIYILQEIIFQLLSNLIIR